MIVLHSKREGKRFWTDYRSTAQLAVTEKKKKLKRLHSFFFNKTLISNSAKILFVVLEFIQPTDTQTGYTRECESLAGTQENGNVRYGTEKLNSSSLSTWTSGFKESAIAGGIVRSPVFRTPKCCLQLLCVAANIVLLKVTASFRRGGILKHGLRRIENNSMQLSILNLSKDKTK